MIIRDLHEMSSNIFYTLSYKKRNIVFIGFR